MGNAVFYQEGCVADSRYHVVPDRHRDGQESLRDTRHRQGYRDGVEERPHDDGPNRETASADDTGLVASAYNLYHDCGLYHGLWSLRRPSPGLHLEH